MDCPICLTNFDSDSALIPELNCSCVFVVHEECWNKWTNNCLYCRNQDIVYTAEPARLYQPTLQFKYRVTKFICIMYFAFMFYMYIFTSRSRNV